VPGWPPFLEEVGRRSKKWDYKFPHNPINLINPGSDYKCIVSPYATSIASFKKAHIKTMRFILSVQKKESMKSVGSAWMASFFGGGREEVQKMGL
jgi:hypothetical protein